MTEPDLPTYRSLMKPVLAVVDQAHGSATKREINEAVVDLVGITEEQLEVTYPETAQAKGSKVLHRIAFAMSSLKGCDALANPGRGIWTLNARGRTLLAAGDQAIQDADKAYRDELTIEAQVVVGFEVVVLDVFSRRVLAGRGQCRAVR